MGAFMLYICSLYYHLGFKCLDAASSFQLQCCGKLAPCERGCQDSNHVHAMFQRYNVISTLHAINCCHLPNAVGSGKSMFAVTCAQNAGGFRVPSTTLDLQVSGARQHSLCKTTISRERSPHNKTQLWGPTKGLLEEAMQAVARSAAAGARQAGM